MEKKNLTIMFTDIKGFTQKTSHSSREQLKKLLELHDELICPFFNEFGGTIIKTIGDAFLVTFHSPTDAVLCGMKIQKELAKYNEKIDEDERLEIRIAINSGEVLVKKGDIFGEAVNIAARLEGIAEPGDIYFTEAVYLSMNKSEIPTAEIGYRHFKGIPEEIKVYKVLGQNIRKGLFAKKEKQVIRGTRNTSQDRVKNIFMWIGVIAVALILLNLFGIGIAVLALLIYIVYRFFFREDARTSTKSKKSIIKTILKWALIIFLILFIIGLLSNQNNNTNTGDTKDNVINQVTQLKQQAEDAFFAGDQSKVIMNIQEIKDISDKYNNPPELEKLISNMKDVYAREYGIPLILN